ncbi:hypothetical protein ABN028_19525 [Actinopolymorpha sp. B17G11]|uniref:hypothetical protein n=1 Tax=Actinopolymorpha sp. B17G11 TaxID=3160861 RepID=UPI0032E42F7D
MNPSEECAACGAGIERDMFAGGWYDPAAYDGSRCPKARDGRHAPMPQPPVPNRVPPNLQQLAGMADHFAAAFREGDRVRAEREHVTPGADL